MNPPINPNPDASPTDTVRPLAPAQRALADALRLCFTLLKLVMLVVVGLYMITGVFSVPEQERAVRLRFGKIVGRAGNAVLEPGGPYFAWPYPIEQVVRIPSAPHRLDLDTEFWHRADNDHHHSARNTGPLDPENDGYLLTGDTNIVHARWSVTFAIDDPVDFVTHVGDKDTAKRLVLWAAQRGIIHAAAQQTADQMVKAQHAGTARRVAQALLDRTTSGISIAELSPKEAVFPEPVQDAVRAVTDAASIKARLIENAQQQWTRTLVQTAGEGYGPLLRLIAAYERASGADDLSRLPELDRQMQAAFNRMEITEAAETARVGGEVAQLIHDANTYRAEVVAQVRGEAEYFNSLLAQYRQNPKIVLQRLWEDTRERVLTGDIETLYVPSGQTWIDLNRDPRVRLARERHRLLNEEELDQDR